MEGARCSSVVERLFMVPWIFRSILHGVTHRAISRSSLCSTTGLTKIVVCTILSMGGAYINHLLLIGKRGGGGQRG